MACEVSAPNSCDTFVVLPSATLNGGVIFGKNSDRPGTEVQEVVFFPDKDHGNDGKLSCTYIDVPQVPHTYAVILSKPAWMWGAEMGANENGVCIGNEAVFTVLQDAEKDKQERLLGMDLVRLGLERSQSAKEALDVITQYLETYGQGGRCFEESDKADTIYHNSFLIADSQEAWVLETAGEHWAAEHVTSGVRNISNKLSIETKIDAMSSNLKKFAEASGYWNGTDEFNFAKIFHKVTAIEEDGKFAPAKRYDCGKQLLDSFSKEKKFDVMSMVDVLRDQASGICRVGEGLSKSVSTGSQVSLLYPQGSKFSCHWFTATPNPACSVFKPFIFAPNVTGSEDTISPIFGADDPVYVKPRFQKSVDRRHALYKEHSKIKPLPGNHAKEAVLQDLKQIEALSIRDIEQSLSNNELDKSNFSEMKDLFKDSVDMEMKFYKAL